MTTQLTWTKTAPRQYVTEIDMGERRAPIVVRGVDDLFFLTIDGADAGFEHRLGDAKAVAQRIADRVAAAREATS